MSILFPSQKVSSNSVILAQAEIQTIDGLFRCIASIIDDAMDENISSWDSRPHGNDGMGLFDFEDILKKYFVQVSLPLNS